MFSKAMYSSGGSVGSISMTCRCGALLAALLLAMAPVRAQSLILGPNQESARLEYQGGPPNQQASPRAATTQPNPASADRHSSWIGLEAWLWEWLHPQNLAALLLVLVGLGASYAALRTLSAIRDQNRIQTVVLKIAKRSADAARAAAQSADRNAEITAAALSTQREIERAYIRS